MKLKLVNSIHALTVTKKKTTVKKNKTDFKKKKLSKSALKKNKQIVLIIILFKCKQ